MIRNGSKVSHDTIKLQAVLRRLGFLPSSFLIDGTFTSKVEKAVKDFQVQKGIAIDGIVGPQTWSYLDDAIGSRNHLFFFLHCAACPPWEKFDGLWIERFHTITKGWSRCGYEAIINLNGSLHVVKDMNNDDSVSSMDYTFGTRVFNKMASHICYVGGVSGQRKHGKFPPEDTRTEAQLKSMETIIKYKLLTIPDLIIVGHNQVQAKACPSFDVPKYLQSIGVAEHNIAHWGKIYS